MDQSRNGGKWISMQAIEELSGKLSISQTVSMNQISLVGDKSDLVEQILECFRYEQHLGLAKVQQFPG